LLNSLEQAINTIPSAAIVAQYAKVPGSDAATGAVTATRAVVDVSSHPEIVQPNVEISRES